MHEQLHKQLDLILEIADLDTLKTLGIILAGFILKLTSSFQDQPQETQE